MEEAIADPEEEPPPAENSEPVSEAAPVSTSLETNASQPDLITTDMSSTLIAPILGTPGSKSDLPTLGSGTGTKPSDKSVRSMTSVFGSKGAASDALVGYFYDLKQNADKTPSDMALNSVEGSKGFDVLNFRNYPETKKYEEVVKNLFATGMKIFSATTSARRNRFNLPIIFSADECQRGAQSLRCGKGSQASPLVDPLSRQRHFTHHG